MIIDTHAHLTSSTYMDNNGLIDGFLSVGGKLLVDIGYSLDSSKQVVENAKKSKYVYCAVGVHPDDAEKEFDNGLIARLSTYEKCIAIGEIGLDYHYDGYNKDKQIELFERQIEIADEVNLPIIIHSRDASKDMLDTLKTNKNHLKNGFLMHCYSESLEQSKNYLDLGGYFAFGGAITFKNSKRGEIIKSLPIDRLLFETDCPYMAPVPHRGEQNKPEFVRLVYDFSANLLGLDMDVLERQIEENFYKFFKKACQ